MGGILIGSKHTEKDWGLKWVDFIIPPAEPMTHTFEVPGYNGIIDLTDAMGGVKYRNRTLSFSFVRADAQEIKEWHAAYSEISNYCHGKVMNVVLDNDKAFYWTGRMVVELVKKDQIYSVLSITMDADPFKYELSDSSEKWLWDTFNFRSGIIRNYKNLTVNTELEINIIGTAHDVVPVFVCSKVMSLEHEGKTYSLLAGENKNYNITIRSGINPMQFSCSGTGTVTILFRGCSL